MLEKLPFYGQVLVFAALALGIVVIAYFVFPNLKTMQAEIDTMQEDLAVKLRDISDGQAIEARLPEFEREIESLKQKLGDVQQILPTGRETGDLLRWIKNLGDQSNLDLKSFSPGGLRPVEFYKEFPIEMNVTGTYHDLGLFLDRVSKYQRIINVDNLRMSKVAQRDRGKTIQASFTATTFVYDEEGATAEVSQ
jgi:type IV pilus assembly protein PilO